MSLINQTLHNILNLDYDGDGDGNIVIPKNTKILLNNLYVQKETIKKSFIDIDYDYKISINRGYSLSEKIIFDKNCYTFYDFIGVLKFYNSKFFNFEFLDNKNSAYGSGATRQIYLNLSNDIVGDILKKTKENFVDIDENNKFWDNISNIKAFTRFILLLLECGCKLPYHLPPRYFEILSGEDLVLEELEYFYDKYYPNTLNNLEEKYKKDPKEFEKLDVGFENYEQMLRSEIINESDKLNIIYYELAEQQRNMFPKKINNVTLDYIFSGYYNIDAKLVLKIMDIQCDLDNSNDYILLWNEFIQSLNPSELKQMLIVFCNSVSLQQKIKIIIKDNLLIDIKIQTCLKTIYVNNKLFKNLETLSNLKIYFRDNDSLNENTTYSEAYLDSSRRYSSLNTAMIYTDESFNLFNIAYHPYQIPYDKETASQDHDIEIPELIDISDDENENINLSTQYDINQNYPGATIIEPIYNYSSWGPGFWQDIHVQPNYPNIMNMNKQKQNLNKYLDKQPIAKVSKKLNNKQIKKTQKQIHQRQPKNQYRQQKNKAFRFKR